MKLVFVGADNSIEIKKGFVHTLEIENPSLFVRISRSLAANAGELIFEDFSLWDDEGNELAPGRTLFMITDPLRLPWDCAELSGKMLSTMELYLFEDDDARSTFESYGRRLQGFAASLTYQGESDYRFNVEWDLRRFLKSFGFSVERGDGLPYIETLDMFLDFISDMKLGKVLAFVNLKTFLGENEFKMFLERVFFHELEVLLLENKTSAIEYDYEIKTVYDQHFLEL